MKSSNLNIDYQEDKYLSQTDLLMRMNQEMGDLFKKYPTPGTFLRKVFGINDVMEFDFPSVDNIKEESVIFDKVKGNHRLIQKSVMTPSKADAIIADAKNAKL